MAKYRIVKIYKNDVLNNIQVEHKSISTWFRWKPLTFIAYNAEIDFSSGNMGLINGYDNQFKYLTKEWWIKEEQEIIKLLNKYYIKPEKPKIKKVIITEQDF